MTHLVSPQDGRWPFGRGRTGVAASTGLAVALLSSLSGCDGRRPLDHTSRLVESQPRVTAPPRPEQHVPSVAEDAGKPPAAQEGDLGVDASAAPPLPPGPELAVADQPSVSSLPTPPLSLAVLDRQAAAPDVRPEPLPPAPVLSIPPPTFPLVAAQPVEPSLQTSLLLADTPVDVTPPAAVVGATPLEMPAPPLQGAAPVLQLSLSPPAPPVVVAALPTSTSPLAVLAPGAPAQEPTPRVIAPPMPSPVSPSAAVDQPTMPPLPSSQSPEPAHEESSAPPPVNLDVVAADARQPIAGSSILSNRLDDRELAAVTPALEAIPTPEVIEDYAIVADIPLRPTELSTPQQITELQQQLEVDREALRSSSAPPVDNSPTPEPPSVVAFGNVPREITGAPSASPGESSGPVEAVATPAPAPVSSPSVPARAIEPAPTVATARPARPATTAAAQPSRAVESTKHVATLFFGPGTTAVGASSRAVLQRVLEEQRATGRSVRIVAFTGAGARGGGSAVPLAATVRVAVERAKAVAESLARLGVDPGSIAVEAVYEPAGTSGSDPERAEIYLQ